MALSETSKQLLGTPSVSPLNGDWGGEERGNGRGEWVEGGGFEGGGGGANLSVPAESPGSSMWWEEVSLCVCACVRVCVRVCVIACVCLCVCERESLQLCMCVRVRACVSVYLWVIAWVVDVMGRNVCVRIQGLCL